MKLSLGKLPPALLTKYVLGMTGAPSQDLVVRPEVGLDFGVVRLRSGFLIVSSDPVTGVANKTGWHAVVVSANDVATSGNRAGFMQSVILLPETVDEGAVRELTSKMADAARRLGITIVGGHTEVTPGLQRPIVMTTAFAIARSFVTAGDAKPGDTLMMTKTAGIEGTAILAEEAARRGASPATVRRASRFFERMSVVEEAANAFETGFVHAMHDCTEGGVLGAVYEMSVASHLGLEVYEGKIPVASETRTVCAVFGVDPLKLIGSGALLMAVEGGREDVVKGALDALGTPVTSIGRFRVGGRMLIHQKRGRKSSIRDSPTDELWRVEKSAHLVST